MDDSRTVTVVVFVVGITYMAGRYPSSTRLPGPFQAGLPCCCDVLVREVITSVSLTVHAIAKGLSKTILRVHMRPSTLLYTFLLRAEGVTKRHMHDALSSRHARHDVRTPYQNTPRSKIDTIPGTRVELTGSSGPYQ
jgi:hypothetical protein